MKHDEKITRARILEILDCKNQYELNDKIKAADYSLKINANSVIYSIMFLWESAGYVITKKE